MTSAPGSFSESSTMNPPTAPLRSRFLSNTSGFLIWTLTKWLAGACEEMFAAVGLADSSVTMFRMRRKDMFMGKWIKHSSVDPWLARLYRPETISFQRAINMTYLTTGTALKLNERLIHYAFDKGMDDWFDKHNRYSRAEAAESLTALEKPAPKLSEFFSSDPVIKRRAIKDLSARVPFRPLARFLYMYIVQRGFLDGRAGFQYCCLVGCYEYMIVSRLGSCWTTGAMDECNEAAISALWEPMLDPSSGGHRVLGSTAPGGAMFLLPSGWSQRYARDR